MTKERMENADAGIPLLKVKYDLHKSPEVEGAAKRHQARTGEKVPQNPLLRIQNYLDRFREITDREDPTAREDGIDAVKRLLHSKYVIKSSEIPESYWETQRRIIRERGQEGDLEHADWEQLKNQTAEALIADQKSSLDKWIDYLSSSDAPYPDSLKYFTLRSVLSMAEFDKEKGAYPQRSKGTTRSFPDLNREALSYVLDAIEKKYKGYDIDVSSLDEKDQKEFEKLLAAENFPKLYAWAIEKVTPASAENLLATHGEWVKYNQGSDHMPLVQSLQGHGTGWCTAGESTAQTQLKGGDFYVYYSYDQTGKPTIPRAAIRMEEGSIAEVRGIAKEQNLDSGIVLVVDEKLKEFPDGESYKKKVEDMRSLTEIDRKAKAGEDLSRDELTFLYEIDSSIEGFGYQKDPRIEELRFGRNQNHDMLVVFDCEPLQIAHNTRQISKDTKAYVGVLEPGIFTTLQQFGIEHIYTKFPEGKIRFDSVSIGDKGLSELQRDLADNQITVSSYAEYMMRTGLSLTPTDRQDLDIVRLKAGALGIKAGYFTTDQIFRRAQELGLDLCPAEVGPQYRLKYKDQPMGDWFYVAMKPITDSLGRPFVFELGRFGDGLWLSDRWAGPDATWHPRDGFVFSLRK